MILQAIYSVLIHGVLISSINCGISAVTLPVLLGSSPLNCEIADIV